MEGGGPAGASEEACVLPPPALTPWWLVRELLWKPGQALGKAHPSPSSSCHLGLGVVGGRIWGAGGSPAAQVPQLAILVATTGTGFCTSWQSCLHPGHSECLAQGQADVPSVWGLNSYL